MGTSACKVMVAWLGVSVSLPNPSLRASPLSLPDSSNFLEAWRLGLPSWLSAAGDECWLGGDSSGSGGHTQAHGTGDLAQDSGLGARQGER